FFALFAAFSAGRSRDRYAGRWPSCRGAGVLNRPGDLLLELVCGVERPVGVAQELAGKEDEVGLVVADDLVGLDWPGDHPDRACGQLGLAVNDLRVRHLVAGADRNLLGRVVASAGDVDQV